MSLRIHLLLPFVFAAACVGESTAAVDAMPDSAAIRIALAQNYAVYQMAMVGGDSRMVGAMTDADAVVTPSGERTLRGRDSVAVGLIDAALRNAITAVERSSSGFRVDGKLVHDSGSYLLTRKRADLGTEERGRYWATWRHVSGLDWVLVRDSLVAARR
jgi:hypothetical protein